MGTVATFKDAAGDVWRLANLGRDYCPLRSIDGTTAWLIGPEGQEYGLSVDDADVPAGRWAVDSYWSPEGAPVWCNGFQSLGVRRRNLKDRALDHWLHDVAALWEAAEYPDPETWTAPDDVLDRYRLERAGQYRLVE